MLPFGVTIPATVPQRSEIPEGLMNNPVYIYHFLCSSYIQIFSCRNLFSNICNSCSSLKATDHSLPPYRREKGYFLYRMEFHYYVGPTGTIHHLQQQMALLCSSAALTKQQIFSQMYIKQDNAVTLAATLRQLQSRHGANYRRRKEANSRHKIQYCKFHVILTVHHR